MRFSAVGDVAMTVPVIHSLATQHPDCRITFLSNRRFEPMFRSLPENVTFLGIDIKKDYDGTRGLDRLFKELQALNIDMVADLHGVLRTYYLSLRFRLAGYKVRGISKDRAARRRLLSEGHNGLKPIRSAFDRYTDVFRKLGLDISLQPYRAVPEKTAVAQDIDAVEAVSGTKGDNRWIGIAPFAAFQGKIYPTHYIEQVVRRLDSDGNCRIFVFAYGKEKDIVSEWPNRYKSTVLISGQLDMWQELLLMGRMDVMLAMDSANMHLASLVGLPVISIWGATHPAAGFLGYGQPAANCIQANLPCRPCSIYGKKPCKYGDYRCMTAISPESVIDRLREILPQ